jgi:hypothetical protein
MVEATDNLFSRRTYKCISVFDSVGSHFDGTQHLQGDCVSHLFFIGILCIHA